MTDGGVDVFLDLACLAYQGADSPERRARAVARLADDPSLGTATVAGAAVTADVTALRRHLSADPTAHASRVGPRSWPPLHYLCYARIPQQDPVGALEVLLEAGADPNAHFVSWGSPFTAITGAIGQGEQGPERLPSHPDARALVTRLLEAGASPNDGQALYNTMLGGDVDWLRLFLASGLTAEHPVTWPIEGEPRMLDFVLAHAVDQGDLTRVELLLSHGADPNAINTYSRRPLHTNAQLFGHDLVASRLVAAGATPTELDDRQRLERALHLGDLEAARAALGDRSIDEPRYLLSACERGDLVTAQFLLDHGADVDGADDQGVTPLHRAAWSDHVEVLRLLLARGADATRRDQRHHATPHDWAVFNRSQAAASFLADPG